MANLEETCHVAIPPEHAFEFFLRPQLVVEISDPAVGLRLLDAPEILSHGDTYSVEFIAFGTVRTVTYQAAIDADGLTMVETMVEGDLSEWAHRKTFVIRDGSTIVTDAIEFEPPSGLAGFLMTADKIADSVADGLAYRNARLPKALSQFSMD